MITNKIYSFETINSLVKTQSKKNGSRSALLSTEGEKITYEELGFIVNLLAQNILKEIPNIRNPRIAIVFKNGVEMAIAMLSVLEVGIAMPLNPNYHRSELEYYLEDLKPDAILTDGTLVEDLKQIADRFKVKLINVKDDLKKIIAKKNETHLSIIQLNKKNSDEIAIVLLTSGSTGRSKKVPLTHKNICISVTEICETLKLKENDLCLCMWEQFHVGGLVDLLLAPLASGGAVLCTSGFNADKFFECLEEFKPTWFQGVPTSYIEILRSGKRKRFNFRINSLRFLRAVASALPQNIQNELEEQFERPVIQTFGMTEAGPLITTNLLPPETRKLGSVGKSSGTEVAIMDTNGNILESNIVGEVVIRGENVFSGYENNQTENEYLFRYDWFHTGDLGYKDKESFLFLTGRLKEQINRGGEKISPQEIDDTLMQHKDILQAATFSMPHPTLGEEVGVAVILKNKELNEKDIEQFLLARLSKFKIPKKIMIVDKLPLNAIGKIERSTLSALSQQRANLNFIKQISNNIEKLLKLIWETELELEKIDLNDDFVSLGGDSLSSLRLMASIEKIVETKLSLDDLDQYKTVALMAEYLENKKMISNQKALEILNELNKENIRSILYSTTIYDSQGLNDELFENFNFNEYKLVLESLLNDATPNEVLEVIQYSDPKIKKNRNNISPFEIEKYTSWSTVNKSRILDKNFNRNWIKSSISKNVFLFKTKNNKNKNLLIGLCGNQMRLMMPLFLFLGSIKEGKCDLLLLRDSTRVHYINGVDGTSRDLESLSDWINSYIKDKKYEKIISIGTSAGGLPSLALGLKNAWKKSIAICPESPFNQLILKDLIQKNKDTNNQTELKVFIGSGVERDKNSAQDLKKVLPEINLFADPECAVHFYLWDLYMRNKLVDFIDREFF